MPKRDSAPNGAPCWADLWTSDVDGARRFYGELLGWQAGEADPRHGGYFLFTRDGAPVAGCMGDMGEMKATNRWQIYLASDNVTKTLELAEAEGANIVSAAMPVDELGVQAILVDPTGAQLGTWQAGSFPGFTVLGEPGTPSWFQLATRDYDRAVAFYRTVFGWDTRAADTDRFRYTVLRGPGQEDLAGVVDAAGWLPEQAPVQWSVYWQVDDIDATVDVATRLGAAVLEPPESTPYGRIAAVADLCGARVPLRAIGR